MAVETYRLTQENIGDYIKQVLNFLPPGTNFEVSEIGDGNINYVFRLIDRDRGASYVLKQSDVLLRSSGRPLSTERSRIEVEALRMQEKLSPGFVPKVLLYDPYMKVIVMEDISDHENLRYALMEGKVFPMLSEHICRFIAETTFPTTDLVMNRQEKKEQVAHFINPQMCDITEDLVFSEPYTDYRKRNVITAGNTKFVNQYIYKDKKLIVEVGKLRSNFMNNAQALLHGDLHTGSVFVKVNSTKIIDPEFAFYGPIGFDVGSFVANLIFAWSNAYYSGNRKINIDFIPWIRETIANIVDGLRIQLEESYRKHVTDPMAKNEHFMDWYLNGIQVDMAGYAGTELIRRIVGDAKVSDLTSIQNLKIRVETEQKLLTIAKQLIMERFSIKEGKDYIRLL